MPLPTATLQELLLDLLSPAHLVTPQRTAALADDDWQRLQTMLDQHRLAPLLHWRLTHEQHRATVPQTMRDGLAKAFQRAALRALRVQREMLLLKKLLTDAGIDSIALKGAYLASHVHPHPAMRPMRDLDVLVPADQVRHAYEVLLQAGYSECDDHGGDVHGMHAFHKHLPLLKSNRTQVAVELHFRLSVPSDHDDGNVAPLWQRRIAVEVGGEAVQFLSPTDLLLHLICHAAYDHRFENGPLLLPDLAYLLQKDEIDWPLFWQRAAQHRWTNGAVLSLHLAQHYYPTLRIVFPADAAAAISNLAYHAPVAARLMLDDTDATLDRAVAASIANRSVLRRLRVLSGKALPAPARLKAKYLLNPGWRGIGRLYCRHWWDITKRLPRLMQTLGGDNAASKARSQAHLQSWLSPAENPDHRA